MPGRKRATCPSILVVEDDPVVRNTLAGLLERKGYRVQTASDGEQALDYLQLSPPPALIILDLMMPVVDGFEFRVRQLQEPALAAVPVIVLSAGDDTARKAEGLHVAACVTKPVDPGELFALVAGCLAARDQP